MERKHKKQAGIPKRELNLLTASAIGGGIGILVSAISVLLSPLILLGAGDPNSLISFATVVCVFLGGLAGAIGAGLLCPDARFRAGLLSAPIAVLPMILLSIIVPSDFDIFFGLIIIATDFAAAFLGAVLLEKSHTSSKKNMKKMMKRR